MAGITKSVGKWEENGNAMIGKWLKQHEALFHIRAKSLATQYSSVAVGVV